MARVVLLALLLLCVTAARRARADDGILLELSSTPEARPCGDAADLRAKIAEHLGHDPLTGGERARTRLHVALGRSEGEWTAEIAVFDSTEPVARRSVAEGGATCERLITAVVSAVEVVLERHAPRGPVVAAPFRLPQPAPEPDLPEPNEERPPPPAPPAPRDALHVDGAFGATGALGGAPLPMFGGEVVWGLDVSRFRFELSGRAHLPATADDAHEYRTRLAYGRLAPCYGWPLISACAVAVLANVAAEPAGNGLVNPRIPEIVFGAVGPGVVSRGFFIGHTFFLRLSIDLLFPLAHESLELGGRRIWTVPPVAAATSLGIGVRLF